MLDSLMLDSLIELSELETELELIEAVDVELFDDPLETDDEPDDVELLSSVIEDELELPDILELDELDVEADEELSSLTERLELLKLLIDSEWLDVLSEPELADDSSIAE